MFVVLHYPRDDLFEKEEKLKMEELRRVFSFPLEEMRELSDYMTTQMTRGLEGKESDLKMIPSFVTSCASGSIHFNDNMYRG